MTKSEALLILASLPQNEKVRLIVDTKGVQVDSIQKVSYHIYWLSKDFASPWKTQDYKMSDGSTYASSYVLDSNMKPKEADCINLVGISFDTTKMDSFDFACFYNDITKPSIEPPAIEYTQEQQEQMWALHYETTQQNHVGYLETSKGI